MRYRSIKIKLMFLLLIVLSGSCAKKTYDKTHYSYYKREITKLNNSTAANARTEEIIRPKIVGTESGKTANLSLDEKERFAQLLKVPTDSIVNNELYAVISKWLDTPYQWGGIDRDGIDCSSLTQQIYLEVYGKKIPRTSLQQFYYDTQAQFQSQKYLREGDLIFFRLRYEDEIVSHVGIYLQNGKFLGSNSPRGVEITDLDTQYWQDKYVASARLLKVIESTEP